MAVIETGRCRRNGMANIFAGIDSAFIEYLSSLANGVSAPTTSTDNLPGDHHPLQISCDVTSLNSDDSGDHHSDEGDDDSDLQDCR